MPSPRAYAAALPAAALLAACGAPPEAPPIPFPAGSGAVVATVDGIPLRASLVAEAAAESGLPPRAALAGLIEETVLAAAARERGLAAAPAVGAVWKKALVQRLLEREVEATAPPVTMEDLTAAYVKDYDGKGLLLEEVWRDIVEKLRTRRRGEAYEALLDRLLRTYKPAVSYGTLQLVK